MVAHAGAPAWRRVDMPHPDPIRVEVDGTTLHARRYVAGHGRMLCWVHGGPTDQWQVEFRPRIAYWWSRGWDVLVVDPRGTTGHGREYQRALNGHWGRLDVDDTGEVVPVDEDQVGLLPGLHTADPVLSSKIYRPVVGCDGDGFCWGDNG